MKTFHSSWIALVLLWSLATLGCDKTPDRVPVSGQVLIDGKPLEQGFIRLLPKGARLAQGSLEEGGRFVLSTYKLGDGCPVGTHPVTVTALEVLSPSKQRWHAPLKYQDPDTSGLTAKIDGPTDDLVINLTWNGGKPFIETTSGIE